MQYWYLWLIFAALVVAFVVVLRFASKALQSHNDEKNAIVNDLVRLKKLKEEYSYLTAEKANSSQAKELLEGVCAVMQAVIEKSDNPNSEFLGFNEAQRNCYTLNYFMEDVALSLSFFYKNNGEPLSGTAHKALEAVGLTELSSITYEMYSMFDENNEGVSLEKQKTDELDSKFKTIYDENVFCETVKKYITENVSEFC